MQSTNSEYGSPYLARCHFTFTFKTLSRHIYIRLLKPLQEVVWATFQMKRDNCKYAIVTVLMKRASLQMSSCVSLQQADMQIATNETESKSQMLNTQSSSFKVVNLSFQY